jgi:CheY-like chemotaxis protein
VAEAAQPLLNLEIVVVDDDADLRELLSLLLGSKGARVRTVGSAAAAMDALAQHPTDVLLADVLMPDEDGYSLIRKLRSRERDHHMGVRLPAIAVTAFAGASDREKALNAGYDWHLAKPIDTEALISAIARFGKAQSV